MHDSRQRICCSRHHGRCGQALEEQDVAGTCLSSDTTRSVMEAPLPVADGAR